MSTLAQVTTSIRVHIQRINNAWRMQYWKTIDLRRRRWTVRMDQLIKRQFNAERRAVVRQSSEAKEPDAVFDLAEGAVIGMFDRWQQTLTQLYVTVGDDLATTAFTRLVRTQEQRSGFGPEDIKQGEEAAASFLGQARNVWLETLSSFIERAGGSKIKDISSVTLRQLRSTINEGIALNESIVKITKRIDRLYLDQITPNRSRVIARTETIAAANLGNRAGALATGLPLEKEWISTQDARTRKPHQAANGQLREMSVPYDVGGEQLMYPLDSSLGASAKNIVQCRCTEGYRVVTARDRLIRG